MIHQQPITSVHVHCYTILMVTEHGNGVLASQALKRLYEVAYLLLKPWRSRMKWRTCFSSFGEFVWSGVLASQALNRSYEVAYLLLKTWRGYTKWRTCFSRLEEVIRSGILSSQVLKRLYDSGVLASQVLKRLYEVEYLLIKLWRVRTKWRTCFSSFEKAIRSFTFKQKGIDLNKRQAKKRNSFTFVHYQINHLVWKTDSLCLQRLSP